MPKRTTAPNLPKNVDFPAALTTEQMRTHEARTDVGIMRRITFASLTRSGRQLIETVDLRKADTAKPLLDMLDFATNYRDYSQANLELATAAVARVTLVLRYLIKAVERLERDK
jgi:hypothetical protein